MVKFVPASVNESAGNDCLPSCCESAARRLLGPSMAFSSSRGEARSSSRSCAATRMADIGWVPLLSVTKPSEGSKVSVYFSCTGGGGYF